MKLFLQKNAKFSSAGGSAPKPPASGGWEQRPQTPKQLRLRISGYAPGIAPPLIPEFIIYLLIKPMFGVFTLEIKFDCFFFWHF